MQIVKARQTPQPADKLDDFEEQIMFGDLDVLLDGMEDDRTISEELVYGVESLKYFRNFYNGKRDLTGADRTRLAAYDAAWCLELIELAQRERAGRHYRA
ncbi:MAG: hypothetical protein KBA75_04980 [Alphaproteobacteria bacterium]|nr:hypothetical protein [Alphaproteobacteria bacterium]